MATEQELKSHSSWQQRYDDGATHRVLLFISLFCLLLTCAGLALIFWLTPYQKAEALSKFVYHEDGFNQLPLPVTTLRYNCLRVLLLLGALLGLTGVWGITRRGNPALVLLDELAHGWARLRRWWALLPIPAKVMAIVVLAMLVVMRLGYAIYYPLNTDEVASYDYFASEGGLAITSYYPIPNNHIFYNILAWPLAAAGLGPSLSMRLPTLLLGTIGTVLSYTLLSRLIGLRLATLLTGLASTAPAWLFYAVAGRGYFLQFCLSQIGFFAAIELMRPISAYRNLSWVAFIISSIIGLYTIPIYVYPLSALTLALAGATLQRRSRVRMPELLLALGAIALLTAVVYAPVVMVSGIKQLVANRYVVSAVTWSKFSLVYRPFLYEKAAHIFGPIPRYSGPAWLVGGLMGWLVTRLAIPAGKKRLVAFTAWLMLGTPLVLMALQRVFPPERTLHYLTYFGYLFGTLVLSRFLLRRFVRTRFSLLLIILLIFGIGGGRVYFNRAEARHIRAEGQSIVAAHQFLRTHAKSSNEPTRVWLNSAWHELYFAHYEKTAASQKLVLRSSPDGQTQQDVYDFLVLHNRLVGTVEAKTTGYHSVYSDATVTIFVKNR